MFGNPTPMDVDIPQKDANGAVQTYSSPNLAKAHQKVDDFIAESMYKFELDLSNLDPEKMYPVYFRFGTGPTSQKEFGEVNLGRYYNWNSGISPSPFSDNISTTHIAGLDFRVVGSDNPYGGAGWYGIKVEMYDIIYMHTMQLFDSHRIPCYIQALDDTVFASDTNLLPAENCSVYSGFYVRGGLLYKGFTKGMASQPTLVTTPTRIFNNTSYNRSEWLSPFKYDPINNTPEFNNYGE
jgi:hypothetical protein